MTTTRLPVESVDVVIVGGGPSGATAAADLAGHGREVLLIDQGDRIKPCGGAIPPLVLSEFDVPESLVTARIGGARIIAPSARRVDMAIDQGWVGMVDRETFDPWLRERAVNRGAGFVKGRFRSLVRDGNDYLVSYLDGEGRARDVRARLVIGADGANSAIRRAAFDATEKPPYVFAYHEIVRAPETAAGGAGFDPTRCDVHYDGRVSPDFYGWIFPHGPVASVGCGSAVKGFDLRAATRALRERSGLGDAETIRSEGAPLPLQPLRRWDNGHGVVLAGDAAGCVAPASGEGIYYAMLTGRYAGEAAQLFLSGLGAQALADPRRRFMASHGRIFSALGFLQRFWYGNDRRREQFTALCAQRDIQRLTWESYLAKKMVRADPLANLRIFSRIVLEMLRRQPRQA